jgi:hypothetical protein
MSTSDVVIRVEGLGKTNSLHHEQGERTTALRDVVPFLVQFGLYINPAGFWLPM